MQTVPFFSSRPDLIIIDEIGKMECLSEKFIRLVVDTLRCARHCRRHKESLSTAEVSWSASKTGPMSGYHDHKQDRDSLVDEIEMAVREGLE